MVPPVQQLPVHVDAFALVPTCSRLTYSNPNYRPNSMSCWCEWKTKTWKFIFMIVTEKNKCTYFNPSLPPTIINLSSITATPNCSRRPGKFFSGVHLSSRGQKLSILINPLCASIPPTANNRPIVDFRGRVRCDDNCSRRSGNKCHFKASITCGTNPKLQMRFGRNGRNDHTNWLHSFVPHNDST